MRRVLLFGVVFVFCIGPGAEASAQEGEYDVVGNLRAFAKLYGYVRFFHPSDEAAEADWNALAIYGARRIRQAGDALDVRRVLLELFRPVAPTLEVFDAPGVPSPWPPYSERFKEREGLRVVAWQHFGVRLSEKSNIYQSLRVNRDPETESLFEKLPGIDEATEARIMGDELCCLLPLTLYADEEGTLPRSDVKKLGALGEAVARIDLTALTADDVDVRLANVVIAWNVLQHFYPYFDVVDVDWDAVLTETLTVALAAKDRREFTEVLKRMVAKLEDGHGVVFREKPGKRGLPPVRMDWIEEKVVVIAVGETESLEKGDVIVSIDGRPALKALEHQERMISGSPHLRRHRALNILGIGEPDSEATIEIERAGKRTTVKVPRTNHRPNIAFSKYTPWDYPVVRELPGGLLHVNLRKLDLDALKKSLPDMAKAKGVIFDLRWGGLLGFWELLPHLTEKPVKSAQWHIPQVIYPDRKAMEFLKSGWEKQPAKPHIPGRSAFLLNPSVASSGETILGIVEHYDLAELVGETTGACNGNVNRIPLPGGYEVMFTGMKVLKHDGSQHHLVGIRPKHPVRRTIAAVLEDRDEVLDRAIDLLNK